jgi:hypothetical protein
MLLSAAMKQANSIDGERSRCRAGEPERCARRYHETYNKPFTKTMHEGLRG